MKRPRSQYLGIRRKRHGWQAAIRIDGHLRTKQFPLATTAEDMQAWRTSVRTGQEAAPLARGTFAADVDDYLARKKAMPSYKQRARFMTWWVNVLGGTRPSRTLTHQEIAVALQALLVKGHSPATVKLIRSALSNFYSTLWGKSGANPVRDVPTPKQLPTQIRSIPLATVKALLEQCPRCASRARLAIMAYTGVPPAQIKTIKAADIDWERAELRVRGRHKGAGTTDRTMPLCPDAVTALQEFVALAAYGEFDTAGLNHFCRRHAKALNPATHITPYMLRHSFLTEIYRLTGDVATTANLAGHALGSPITRVYIGAAVSDVARAAVAAFGAKVAAIAPRAT